MKINLTDMDYKTWRDELKKDAENLELPTLVVADIAPEHDLKIQKLLNLLDEKVRTPISKERGVLMSGNTKEIDDGKNMKKESVIDSLCFIGGTSVLMNAVSRMNDFEIICFLVVR